MGRAEALRIGGKGRQRRLGVAGGNMSGHGDEELHGDTSSSNAAIGRSVFTAAVGNRLPLPGVGLGGKEGGSDDRTT
jgi:hypothetical protein